MQQVSPTVSTVLNKITRFLKRSFLFSVLSSTMLYIFVRFFFYEFPFTTMEAVELYAKIFTVIWGFFIGCKIAFELLLFAEKGIGRISLSSPKYIPVLKKTALLLLAAVLVYTIKIKAANNLKPLSPGKVSTDDKSVETGFNVFYKIAFLKT